MRLGRYEHKVELIYDTVTELESPRHKDNITKDLIEKSLVTTEDDIGGEEQSSDNEEGTSDE